MLNLLLSLSFFLVAFCAYRKLRKLRERAETADVTNAIVTLKEVGEGKYGAYRYYLFHRFYLSDKPVEGKAEVSAGIYSRTAIGDTLEVMYERHNPEINYLRRIFLDRVSTYQALCFLLVVSGVVVWMV